LKTIKRNPDDRWYAEFLKPYYIFTKDGQYLFASKQPGRRPDRAFYMVPKNYKLGAKQKKFDTAIGKKLYEVAFRYLMEEKIKSLVIEGIQGEAGYETGLRITVSLDNPHSAYIAWFGKLMIFPPKPDMKIHCWNYIIPEQLPEKYVKEIKEFWPDYNPEEPITLYDLTESGNDIRRVLSLGIDYFGGAFKKPNLTMTWNRGEADGLISYHAGCTSDRVLKGLSGTGKTTLTVGPELEQDDALLGKPIYEENGNIKSVQIIGLEAASYAKSQGLNSESPEWVGLMKSKEIDAQGNRPIVLAQNIDCEGIDYVFKKIGKYEVKIPQQIPDELVGSLQCERYEKSGTTNGRFVFLFSELNKEWGLTKEKKFVKTESLSFKRFDALEPAFRVTDPAMAVALDSACESVITSAIAGAKVGSRVRSYAATDFMAREQSGQALLKWKMYKDIGLGENGKLVFFINNAGKVGEYDIQGNQIRKPDERRNPIEKIDKQTSKPVLNERGEIKYKGSGEDITVKDSKKLVELIEQKKIERWIKHPVYKYLIPDPKELEEKHGMENFAQRFNLLNYYTAEQIREFILRDIKERTEFLQNLFKGQEGEEQLHEIINVWNKLEVPPAEEIQKFYEEHYC
ncbi:MAG: phosphoenolpyruvate carboxykinase (ATP), partial [Candidatus Aenigmarchaeota archaeon]|nr:phosphoenolpyruvate carboxykinase (ATP) [Candidatus Aenigmarchaeota archaeon]